MIGARLSDSRLPPVSATADHPDKMMHLQKMRIVTVIRLTQENAMVLTLQQRVAGKEIEVMVFERDAGRAVGHDRPPANAPDVQDQLDQMKELLAHHEAAVQGMEENLRQIDDEITALCQS